MFKPQSLLTTAIISLLAFFTSACNDEKPVAKIIVVDKKMPLIEWPDSVYVNSLDSILALEPVAAPKKNTVVPNLYLDPQKFSAFKPPKNFPGNKEHKNTAQNSQNHHGKGLGLPSGREDNISGKKAEAFSDKFLKAMSALQSDPNNSSLYKIVVANDEDLSKFLRRTYGAGSLTLPLFFVRSSLQTVNPGINLEKLNAGDKVKVPRI